jgi:hypothetical protein
MHFNKFNCGGSMFRAEAFDDELRECKDAKGALRMSLDRSGRSQKVVAIEIGMSDVHLSRCLNSNDAVNLPHNKVVPFMVSCGNSLYLRWLHVSLRELLPELENDDGGCIIDAVETLRLELREAITEIKAAMPPKRCSHCEAQFALDSVAVPGWLVNQVWLIEEEFGRML